MIMILMDSNNKQHIHQIRYYIKAPCTQPAAALYQVAADTQTYQQIKEFNVAMYMVYNSYLKVCFIEFSPISHKHYYRGYFIKQKPPSALQMSVCQQQLQTFLWGGWWRWAEVILTPCGIDPLPNNAWQ